MLYYIYPSVIDFFLSSLVLLPFILKIHSCVYSPRLGQYRLAQSCRSFGLQLPSFFVKLSISSHIILWLNSNYCLHGQKWILRGIQIVLQGRHCCIISNQLVKSEVQERLGHCYILRGFRGVEDSNFWGVSTQMFLSNLAGP